ncbi:MAG: hypothetical protein B7X06_04250, partial [Verrucomicrobia bacterium 21-51-4]
AAICQDARAKARDGSDNANSIVLLLSLGEFQFFDGGDLTWNMEQKLVCPKNLVGEVDVYQTTHHGLDASNNPLVIRSLKPKVAVFNNGVTKGCEPDVFAVLDREPSVEAVYQMHRNLRSDSQNNVADEYIANLEKECQANYIKLAAIIGVSAIVLSILLSFFFRKQITEPIKRLSVGARRLGSGEFNQPIVIKSKDELSDLAETFNKMAGSIKKLVGDLKSNNVSLLVEQTKLNNIIRSVSDGVIALDKAGDIVTLNPPAAKLVGKQLTELRGKPLKDFYHWEQDNEQFSPDLSQPGTYHYTDLVLPRGKENPAYLDLMVSVLDQKDSDVSVIITIHDQTQSRELDFMKLDFVAIAAHELRTPLTVVRGYLDMLKKNV